MLAKDFRSGYQIRDQNAPHFMTFTVCGWIDLFTRKEYKDILIDTFRFYQQQRRLLLYAFVIMTNHLHLLAAMPQNHTLSDFVRDFKKYTHKRMIAIIESDKESRRLWMLHQFKYHANRHKRNENYQIWTNDNHAEECFSKAFTDSKVDYIHNNPVRAGIVNNPWDYVYSSAANYQGLKGILDVVVI